MVYIILHIGSCSHANGRIECVCQAGWGGLRCKQPFCGNKGCPLTSNTFNRQRTMFYRKW